MGPEDERAIRTGNRTGRVVGRLLALGALTLGIMAPVTMPVPVLRELVYDRFAVSELATSLFMSINMLGALLAAPLAGAAVDRGGRGRESLIAHLYGHKATRNRSSEPRWFLEATGSGWVGD